MRLNELLIREFTDPQLSDLLFMRCQRDGLAREVENVIDHQDAAKWIGEMIEYHYANSAYHAAKNCTERNPWVTFYERERLELFYAICLRIARLEREALGAYVEKILLEV